MDRCLSKNEKVDFDIYLGLARFFEKAHYLYTPPPLAIYVIFRELHRTM